MGNRAMASLTRSGPKHALSLTEQLPADVMTKILEFSKLPERLQLARCSTILLKLITKDCTALRVTIVSLNILWDIDSVNVSRMPCLQVC